MATDPTNTNDLSASTGIVPAAPRRWPLVLCLCICCYFLLSALTLPFVNTIWLGEWPPLAIVQLPKSFFKSIVQQFLMSIIHLFGLSHGSRSPDYSATHGWAMMITVTVPALFIISVFSRVQSFRNRRLMAAIAICAAFDAVVTLWYDSVSNLALFNAIYL